MNSREELALKREQETYQSMAIPVALEDQIRRGIEKGRKERRRVHRRRGLAIACCFLVLFISGIRVSPAFAALVERVPGLSYLVELVQYDQGLKNAVENEFFQVVDQSQRQADLEFTVKSIIVDESQLLIFYSVEDFQERGIINLERVTLQDEAGNSLSAAIAFNMGPDSVPYKEGMIQVVFGEEAVIPETVILQVKLAEMMGASPDTEQVLDPVWQIAFQIDHEKFVELKQVYEINQTLEIQGQKIVIRRLTHYPTKMTVEYELDPENTLEIFGFYKLSIANEAGLITGGAGGIQPGSSQPYVRLAHLESRFFEDPKEIYLQAEGIYALDKSLTTLTLDLEEQELIGAHDPDIGLLEVKPVQEKEALEFVFGLRSLEEQRAFFPFSATFTDGAGQVFEAAGMSAGTYAAGGFSSETRYLIPLNQGVQSPVTLEIIDFSKILQEPVRVKIK